MSMHFDFTSMTPLWPCLPLDIVLQEKMFPVKHGIREEINPIAQNHNTRRSTQHQVKLYVAMPVNEIADVGMSLQVFL